MNSSRQIGSRAGAPKLFETLENRLLFAFGELDAGFGVAGRTLVPFPVTFKTPDVQQMLVLGNGKILAGGTTGLTLLDSAGRADTTFGSSGKVQLTQSATFIAEAIDPGNSNIYALVSAHNAIGLLRYTANGRVDGSFGTGGTVTVTDDTNFTAQAMTVQPDGKIIIAGVFATNSNDGRKVRVYRLRTDGTTDSGFGDSGIKQFNFGVGTFLAPVAYDRVAKVAIVSGNKIDIIGGSIVYSPPTNDPIADTIIPASYDRGIVAVARLTSAGALDTTYTGKGISRATVASAKQAQDVFNNYLNKGLYAAALRTDDSVLVSGRGKTAVVVEFNSSGGIKYTSAATPGSLLDTPLAVTPLNDGRSVLLAKSDHLGGADPAFVALSSTGEYSNVLFVKDNEPTTIDLTAYPFASAATASDGSLLLGGTGHADSFEVEKFLVGKSTDPRPDEFAGGTVNDIASDLDGGLYLAYYDSNTTHLMFAHRNSSGLWDNTITLDKNPKAGQFLSLDVNSKHEPGIAYYDGTNGDLKLAQRINGKWKFENVDSKANAGQAPSLDYDDKDEPVISYYHVTNHRLNFAIKKGNLKWTYEVVDTSGDNVGRSNALVASPISRRYTIAYTDDTSGKVMWAKHNTDGTWLIKTAAKTTGGADFVSMAYGNDYQPMVAFFDKANADLKISSYLNKAFSVKPIATAGVVGSYTQALFGDFYGAGQVFAYNKSNNSVVLYQNVNTAEPTVTTVATEGGKYLSVSFDQTTNLAFVDPITGKLKVRPSTNP
jgi:uncharacterized delta-60 repeat protein